MLNKRRLLISFAVSLLVSAVTIGVSFWQISLYEKRVSQRPIYCNHPGRGNTDKIFEYLEPREECVINAPKLKYGVPFKLTGKIDRSGDRVVISQDDWFSGKWGINYYNAVGNFLIYLIISYPIVLFFNRKKKSIN